MCGCVWQLLEAKQAATIEVSKLRQELAARPVAAGTASSDVFDTITRLNTQYEQAERQWQQRHAELEADKRGALRDQHERHTAEMQTLKEDKWRLEDSVRSLKQQLTELGRVSLLASFPLQRPLTHL